ncbi:Zinc finger BED domain containing protein [Gracilaria domingensis]|nr:Zinc finger BED domain containing protein [Gracilaria domingensis]
MDRTRIQKSSRTDPNKSNRSFLTIESKEAAVEVVRKLMEAETTEYELVEWKEMRKVRKMRSEHYNNYAVLCHLNTKKDAGWLVCSYLISGQCSLHASVKRFDPELGTSFLKNHTKLHNSLKTKSFQDNVLVKVSETQKRNIIDAAAYAVSCGLLPLSFAYKNVMMEGFVRSLVDAGRSVPVNAELDVKDMLPSNNTVRDGIRRIAQSARYNYRTNIVKNVLELGGGVTSDGLKNDVNGTKFYDFTAHYFEIGAPHLLTRAREFSLVSRNIFLIEHKGVESASALRSAFDHALLTRIGCELDEFMKNFTFVTDCASTMPCIVGASASSQRVPYTEKWMGCISHQLNTVMKHAMEKEMASNSVIAADLLNVKTVVRIFKQGNWNQALPDGFALVQEIETRFGTVFGVVERFLKSSKNVASLIARKDSEPAKKAFDSLITETTIEGDIVYPALEAIVTCFRPICHVQKQLEAQNKPTMHLILPMLEQLETQQKQISNGMVKGPNFQMPHVLSQQFAKVVLQFLSQIEIHSLWIAGSLLHPRMRSLSFVRDTAKRNVYRGKGSVLVKRMLRNYDKVEKKGNEIVATDVVAPKELGTDSFCLSDMFDVADTSEGDIDSFEKYMSRKFPLSISKPLKTSASDEDHGTKLIRFWINQEAHYPDLSKVALRIYATPVSSSTSERNFSAVNRILTAERSRLKSDVIEDMLYLRSIAKK